MAIPGSRLAGWGAGRSGISVVLLAVLAAAAPSAAREHTDPRQIVAVLELKGDGSLDDEDLAAFTDTVRTEVFQVLETEVWFLMTRENILELIDANAADLADCIGGCEVETGRLLGAHTVVTGSLTQIDGEYQLILNRYETASGWMAGSQHVSARTVAQLWRELPGLCLALFQGERGALEQVPDRSIHGGLDAVAVPTDTEYVVEFHTSPPGAAVSVDGRYLCDTPCSKALPAGPHRALLVLSRYHAVEETFSLSAPARIARDLAPQFGWLSVTSEPEGIPLTLDGEPAGKTPMTKRETAPGTYSVLLDHPSWFPDGRVVSVNEGEHKEVRIDARARNGLLQVEAVDAAGNDLAFAIRLDGRPLDTYTPARIKLQVGDHQVSLLRQSRASGARQVSTEVSIDFGETTSVRLDASTGRFDVRTLPATGQSRTLLRLRSAHGEEIPRDAATALWDRTDVSLRCGDRDVDYAQLVAEASGEDARTRRFDGAELPVGDCTLTARLDGRLAETNHSIEAGTVDEQRAELPVDWAVLSLEEVQPEDRVWVVLGTEDSRPRPLSVASPLVLSSPQPLTLLLDHGGLTHEIGRLDQPRGTVQVHPYGRLHLPRACRVAGLGVRIDGREYPTQREIPVPVGSRTVQLAAPEHFTAEHRLAFRAGASTTWPEPLVARSGPVRVRLALDDPHGEPMPAAIAGSLLEHAEVRATCAAMPGDAFDLVLTPDSTEPGVGWFVAPELPAGECGFSARLREGQSEVAATLGRGQPADVRARLTAELPRVQLARLVDADQTWLCELPCADPGQGIALPAGGTAVPVPARPHALVVDRRGAWHHTGVVEPGPGTLLVDPYATLVIPDEPWSHGARVLVDGAAVDVTRDVVAPAGEHEVVIEAEYHHPFAQTLTLGLGERREVRPVPRDVPTCFEGLPRGATVLAGGTETVASGPRLSGETCITLQPGTWAVRVTAAGRMPFDDHVTVSPSPRMDIQVQLRFDEPTRKRRQAVLRTAVLAGTTAGILGAGVGLGGRGEAWSGQADESHSAYLAATTAEDVVAARDARDSARETSRQFRTGAVVCLALAGGAGVATLVSALTVSRDSPVPLVLLHPGPDGIAAQLRIEW